MKKKLLLSSITLLIVLSACYTGFWFFTKNKIEQSFEQSFNYIKKAPNVKYASYNLNVNCFPFLCINLNNVNIKSIDKVGLLKKGMLIKAFSEKPFIYKTKNIFKQSANILQENKEYDFIIFNPENKLSLNYNLRFSDLNIIINKNKLELNINRALLERATDRTAYVVTMDVSNFNLYYYKNLKATTSDILFGYNLTDLNIVNPDNTKHNIKHSLLKFALKDISNNLITKISNKNNKAGKVIVKNIDSLIKNKTTLQVTDFKLTDDNLQMSLKGIFNINNSQHLNAMVDSSIQPLKEDSLVAKMLTNTNIGKNKNGSYIINVRTNNNDITINKDIHINSPKF